MNENSIGTNTQMVTLDALKASKSKLERLLETFEAIEDKLDPAPAPKPDTVNPNVFRIRNSLRNELEKIEDVLDKFVDAAKALNIRMNILQKKICDGRNKGAWGIILKHAAEINQSHFDKLVIAAQLYEQHAIFMERLVTFANADCLPDEG